MKTSTFLTKVLKKFGGGKNYTKHPYEFVTNNFDSDDYYRIKSSKGKGNLVTMIDKVANQTGVNKQKAMLSIAKSLGHTNVNGFATSLNTTFGKVRPVLKAAIKRERAAGN